MEGGGRSFVSDRACHLLQKVSEAVERAAAALPLEHSPRRALGELLREVDWPRFQTA